MASLDLIRHPKFFLFDCGVYNGMLRNFTASADRIGALAEQLVFSQILHSGWSREADTKISSFRTRGGVEVDFIFEVDRKVFAVEVKASDAITTDDCAGLEFFSANAGKVSGLFISHMGSVERRLGKVWALP